MCMKAPTVFVQINQTTNTYSLTHHTHILSIKIPFNLHTHSYNKAICLTFGKIKIIRPTTATMIYEF